ncbi:long-chain-fatty-acid--CoA ligase, partial [Aquisalimonas sp.]|uniref:long-chain-fatty-acid--CoA ligase n=1 Tax=Aquisalimonas sp. TaxID=1872621 RepID=UPI0025BF485D
LYMQNSPQYIIGYYGILTAGAVVVPANPMNLTAELTHYVHDSGARVALCAQELYPNLRPLLIDGELDRVAVAAYAAYATADLGLSLPDVVRVPEETPPGDGAIAWTTALAEGEGMTLDPVRVRPEDMAVIPYTSGSTGRPKGCVHTHRSVMATAQGGVLWNPMQADHVNLATLPFFHVTGMQSSMNGPLSAGATSVVMTRWDRTTAAELIQHYGVSHWRNITTMAVDFLNNPELERYDLSTLQAVGGGGAAMPTAIAEKLQKLTGLSYIEGYGMSETIAQTHVNPPQAPRAQCLGIPVFDVDSRIIDPDTLEEKGPGEVGEIIMHGPQIMREYWNNPQATAETFIEIDGKRFLRSGDLGYYDENGYFFMVDRLKRMINASGYKVWPSEVESMLYAHPDIQEVCVIATPDPKRGETVKAVVVLRPGAAEVTDEQAIIDWARGQMAAYKAPRYVEFVERLPRSGTGKLLWRELQDAEGSKAG